MPQDVNFFLPFRARTNPEAGRAQEHHLGWVRDFGLVRDETSLSRYQDWRLTELASYAYPDARGEDLDLVTDAVCLGFPLDDQFDGPLGRQPERVARLMTELAAIPYRRPGAPLSLETPLTWAYADVWRRCAEGMSAAWRERAAGNLVRFFRSYVEEARNRQVGADLDEDSYVRLRREAVGTTPCFDLIERAHHAEVPPEAYWSTEMQSLIRCAGDVIFLCNDAHSVEREERHGEPHNLVLIRQRARGCSRQESLAQVAGLVRERVERFLTLAERLPESCSRWRLDAGGRAAAERFVEGLQGWMIGNQRWGVVSARYAERNAVLDIVEDGFGPAPAVVSPRLPADRAAAATPRTTT